MNQTLVRRAGLVLGMWRLFRYQARLCRWFPITVVNGNQHVSATEVGTVRWLGRIRVGRHAHHALFVPPGLQAAYRFAAPPHSRLVAWCSVVADGSRHENGVEFVATARTDRAPRELTARLRLTPRERRWRKLVLDLQNREEQQIELTLSIPMEGLNGNAVKPSAIWGEPRLEWPRPMADRRAILLAASRLVRRGKLIAAARTLHERLSEGSYPFWLRERSLSSARVADIRKQSTSLPYRPLVSVITPVYNTDPRWLRACIESVRGQLYANWQLCLADDGSTRADTRAVLREYESDPRIKIKIRDGNCGIAAALNEALTLAQGEFVAFLDHDDELTPDALFEVVAHLNQHRDADFIYSDEDKLEVDGTRSNVYFKPDWSPEHFLTNMYTCHLMVLRRALVERIGGFRRGYEGAQDYDLVLRLIDVTARIHHVPKVLYQWRRIPESTAGREGAKPWAHDAGRLALEDYVRRNKLNAEVLPGVLKYQYRVRYRVQGEPLISVVLPMLPGNDASGKDVRRASERTLRMLVERTAYRRIEVLLPVARTRPSDATAQILRKLTVREVLIEEPRIHGRLHHQTQAAVHARGEHLLFLDWGLKAIDHEWLTALLEFSQQLPIGVVGAKLHYPDGSLKHIGIVLGVNGVVAPAFHRHSRSSLGYWGAARAARNYSAVSGACLMTRRAVYDEVSGFDDEMGGFADVDYCLRVARAGYRIVFTPHAPLVHDESWRPAADDDASAAKRLQMRWSDRLRRDPYYNPNLSRNNPDYEPDLIASADQTMGASDSSDRA